jgi:hypothetical protein
MGMALKLYFHPLASFCHKALIALYENRIPFEPIIVDLRDELCFSGRTSSHGSPAVRQNPAKR